MEAPTPLSVNPPVKPPSEPSSPAIPFIPATNRNTLGNPADRNSTQQTTISPPAEKAGASEASSDDSKPSGFGWVWGLAAVLILLFAAGGWFTWRALDPENPTPLATQLLSRVGRNTTTEPSAIYDDGNSPERAAPSEFMGDGEENCTEDAHQCSDGSFVGRTGPDCSFTCPDGNIVTVEPFLDFRPIDSRSTQEEDTFDSTYNNPEYRLGFNFPDVLDVRDTKPYPRDDIIFRHGFYDRDINIDDGYVEASTLSIERLLEIEKKADPESKVTRLTDKMYDEDVWQRYVFSKELINREHIFAEKDGVTYHFISSGLSSRVRHFAEDIRIEQK